MGSISVLFTLIAEHYERGSLGITSNLVFLEWKLIFANAAAIDRVVHHSIILESNVPSYRMGGAQQGGESKDVGQDFSCAGFHAPPSGGWTPTRLVEAGR